MTEQFAIDLARNALTVVIEVAGPILLASLAVGMLVSIFQAVTQIHEPTLTFVPKILAVGALIAFLGPWMGQVMVAYTVSIFNTLPALVR
jgi:flagellar biosynthetic protein FliQ